MTDKERLEKLKQQKVWKDASEFVFLTVDVDDYKFLHEKAERVQELERDLELCDSAMHIIDMTINNPSTSDDDKWEKVNKTMKKYYADDCIHCNGKGFNGLDYCPYCICGEILQENIELEQQNKRYRETIESVRSEIKYALYSNKSEDVKIHYLQNAEREATEALEESE